MKELVAAVVLTIATGCVGSVVAPVAGGSDATLDVAARFAPASARVQALVEPYTVADVEHLRVKVFRLEGSSETEVLGADSAPLALDLGSASLTVPIRFRHLHFDTTYRVRGYAYRAPGAAGADVISSDSASYLDIKLTNDDRPDVATLSVQLVDKTFNARGTASVDVHDGGVHDEGPETFGVPVI